MNDDNNSVGATGNRSRFKDRLNKIRKDRLIKTRPEEQKENKVKYASRNILKIALALPSVIYHNTKFNQVVNDNKSNNSGEKLENNNMSNFVGITNPTLDKNNYNERLIKVEKIKEINLSSLKKKKEMFIKSNSTLEQSYDKDNNKIKLQKEIINIIKKKLIKNINELEILQSELYLLKQFNGNDLYLKECQNDIKEIKKLLSKIKSLKEKYNYLNDSVSFEYMLEHGDDLLIDKILELKELCSNVEMNQNINDYKILNEYKYLYLKTDKLQENIIKYEEYKKNQVEELKRRDIDFDKLKASIYDVDMEKDRYERFIKDQDSIINDLNKNLHRINSYESVSYRVKGFEQLLWNSFKYLGLLLMSPFKGTLPGIAMQTVVTRNVIHNLYDNLEWEENRKMVYQTIDYSNLIEKTLNDLDTTESLVNSTLEEIVELKNKYMKQFKKYEYSFPNYQDTISKINKMENAVLGSKIKIELMKKNMLEKEKENDDKMKKVKKLNSSIE